MHVDYGKLEDNDADKSSLVLAERIFAASVPLYHSYTNASFLVTSLTKDPRVENAQFAIQHPLLGIPSEEELRKFSCYPTLVTEQFRSAFAAAGPYNFLDAVPEDVEALPPCKLASAIYFGQWEHLANGHLASGRGRIYFENGSLFEGKH